MARKRRRWPWLLLPLLVVAALYLGQTEMVGRIAARAIEAAAERATGEQVTIGRIDLNYLPPHVEIEGLLVTHEPTGETIVAARVVHLEPGIERFRPVLRKLALDGPRVSLHLDADGLREFRGPHAAGSRAADTFPWKELTIRDGSFSFAGAGVDIEVLGVAAAPAGQGANTTNVTVDRLRLSGAGVVQEAGGLVFPGVTVGPDRMEIPAFALDFDAVRIEGGLAAVRGGPIRGDLSLHADLARLTRRPERVGYEDGALDVDVTLGGTTAAPLVSGVVAWTDLVLWRGVTPRAIRIGDAVGSWRLLLGGEHPALALNDLRMEWVDGVVTMEALVDLTTRTATAGGIAESISLARIFQAVGTAPTPWVDLVGDVEMHVSGTLSPFAMSGPFEVDVAKLRVSAGPLDGNSRKMLEIERGTVEGEVSFDARRLVLDGEVATGRSRARVRADIGFASVGALSVDMDFDRLDLAVLAPLGDARLGGIVEMKGWLGGPYNRLHASAQVRGEDLVVLGFPIADGMTATLESVDLKRLHFTDVAAELGASRYRGDFLLAFDGPMFLDTQLYVANGHLRDFSGIFLDLGDVDGTLSGTAVLSGEPYHLDGEVELQLADVNLYGERFASGHATSWMDDGELTIEELSLKRRDEALLLRGSVKRGYRLNLDVLSDGVAIEDLDHVQPLGLRLTGDVALDGVIGGTLFEPEPRGRITTRGTYFGNQHIENSRVDFATVDGTLRWDGHLVGDALGVDGRLGLWDEQPYSLTARFDAFPAHLAYPMGADGRPIEARLSGELTLGGRLGDDPTPVDIDATFPHASFAWSGHVLSAPEPWVFSVHQRKVDVHSLKLEGDDGTAVSFEGYADRGGQLAFRGLGKINLDLARALTPGLEEARGMGNVEVQVDRAALPAVFDERPKDATAATTRVKLDFKDATFRGSWFPADFEAVAATIRASADRYEITGVTGRVGGGALRSPANVIHAVGWVPRRYELAGTLTDGQVQYLDYLPPMTGDAALRFDGPAGDLLLSGSIAIDRMEFRERIDWEAMVLSFREERLTGSAPQDRGRYFGMDLDVTADDTIHVRNNLAEADASARLRVIGDTQRPGMVGEIRAAPGGHMFIHEREFEIARGEVRYVDPYTFDPELDIQLETQVRSYDQDYQVAYAVTGPFSDWHTSTGADPWLSQADINALLLFGVTREELERYGAPVLGTALVAETSDLLLAQTAFTRLDFFVDRWSLVSGVSERGSSNVSSELRLVASKMVGPFDFTVEKNLGADLGTDWYASVERRITQKLYASAYVATRQEGRSLPIGGAYGAEFKFRWEAN